MREAPAITDHRARCSQPGAKVQAYDPEATRRRQAASSATAITYAEKSYDALNGADALAIVTEWNEFREPDFARMRKLMKAPVVFDGRNIYTPEQMTRARLHLLLHWPLSMRTRPGDRRRRLHRQPRRQGAAPRPATTSSSTTTSSAGHREAAALARTATLDRGRHPRRRRGARGARATRRRRR